MRTAYDTYHHLHRSACCWLRRTGQPGDVPRTWADIDRAREVQGHGPPLLLGEDIERCVDWLRRRDG